LKVPQRRIGAKGEGRFVPISWQDALDEIAEKTQAIIDQHGAEAILPYSYAGTMGLIQRDYPYTFFRALGASELDFGTICAATGGAAWDAVYGPGRLGTDCETVVHSKLIILWGINSLRSNSHLTPFLKEARRRGAVILHIDPYRNESSHFADEHWQLKPCTDAALALALGHVILREGLADALYLERYASGLDEYRQACATWTPERAADYCGLEADRIEAVARAYATSGASFIRVGYGMTRNQGGGNAMKAVVLLPALIGAWQQQGGGALLSTSGAFPLNTRRTSGLHLKQENRRLVNMNQLASALAWQQDPLKALFVFNSNPAAVAPNSAGIRRGLARDDLLTVVLEHFQTDTADYADYLLPATNFLEHADLYTSYGHYYLQWAEPVVEAAGECRPNSWVFQALAKRLGLRDEVFTWSPEDIARELLDVAHPRLQGISLEALQRERSLRLSLGQDFQPYARGSHHDDAKIRFAPAPLQLEAKLQPHPAYPLRLISPPGSHFVNTSMANMPSLLKAMGDEPSVLVHPADAERYQLVDGQRYTISSPQGEICRRIKVSEAAREGVVIALGLWWPKLAPDKRGLNDLTHEALTDMGSGSMFGDVLVSISAASD
jgi:anaerobic selenocysteine-containing dehydrogenase